MGMYEVAEAPLTLVSLGLGSCVGVAIYDAGKKTGGLAHVMLPEIDDDHSKDAQNPNKYANLAVPAMVKDLEQKGCDVKNLRAKIAGGAHMFPTLSKEQTLDIGRRNVESVSAILKSLGISLRAERTGGSVGRTVRFDLSTGMFSIKTKEGVEEI